MCTAPLHTSEPNAMTVAVMVDESRDTNVRTYCTSPSSMEDRTPIMVTQLQKIAATLSSDTCSDCLLKHGRSDMML